MTSRLIVLTLGFTLAAALAPAQAQTGTTGPAATGAAPEARLTLKQLLYRARRGDVVAQRLLGDRYDRGNGLPRDYGKAIYWYSRAAKQGDRAAQRNLGYIYEAGLAGEQDYAEAEKWYRKAAEQGDPEAQRSLAYIYESGLTGRADPVEAAKWADRAARRPAADATAEIPGVDPRLEIRSHLTTNTNQDDTPEHTVGTDEARPLDIGLALNRYQPDARAGDAYAQYRLGIVYLEGRGVLADQQRARLWLNRSAEAGYARAQALLGTMYAKGIGTHRDLAHAYFWLQQAVSRLPDGATKDFARNFGEAVERAMTPAQQAKASQLARDFSPEPQIAPATIR